MNEQTKIIFLPTEKALRFETDPLAGIIREKVLTKAKTAYAHCTVRTSHKPDGAKDLVAYLAHQETFKYETTMISVDKDNKVQSINENHKESENDFEATDESFSDDDTEMVFATPITDWPSCPNSINAVYDYAVSLGYKVKKLIGNDANRANYKYWLTKNLKAFGSIGHGNSSGILLSDGSLTYQWFEGLSSTALNPEVIYLNSCEVFNDPLLKAIKNAGPRTYIGGITTLRESNVSEQCFVCFWKKELKCPSSETMKLAVDNCAKQYDPNDKLGFFGDQGKFC